MACKLVLLLACACAIVGAARVSRREAPAAATPLQDIQKHAEELQKQIVESISKFTSSKSAADYKKTLEDSASSVVQQLSTLSSTWETALKDATGKAKEAIEASRASIDKTVADLRKAHPEVEQQASALGDRLSQAVTTALQESQKVAQQVQEHAAQTNKELAPKLEAAYDDFSKQVQDVQKKLHEAVTKQ